MIAFIIFAVLLLALVLISANGFRSEVTSPDFRIDPEESILFDEPESIIAEFESMEELHAIDDRSSDYED